MITFSKDLLSLNPAYNDSIIEFSSNFLFALTRARIVIGGHSFNAIAFNNRFTFNFKEIVKVLINSNRHDDVITPNLSGGNYIYDDSNVVKSYNVVITIYNQVGQNESINKTYNFIRGVEQLPNYKKKITINPSTRVLLPTDNYVDYNVKYWEGYPFDFAVQGLTLFQPYFFKNITTNQQTTSATTSNTHVKRIFISDGANSTTESDILVANSTLNKLEFYDNNTFKANIYLKKEESRCGVYLKWLNSKGSYSYWLFDNGYKGSINTKIMDEVGGKYDNLQSLTSTSYITGKNATQTLALSTSFEGIYRDYLTDLMSSPAVWMYQYDEPFHQQEVGDFLGVVVSAGNFQNIDKKLNKGKLNLTITLPTVNTITN